MFTIVSIKALMLCGCDGVNSIRYNFTGGKFNVSPSATTVLCVEVNETLT